jgi:thiamine-phosphate pyrophosphorylase
MPHRRTTGVVSATACGRNTGGGEPVALAALDRLYRGSTATASAGRIEGVTPPRLLLFTDDDAGRARGRGSLATLAVAFESLGVSADVAVVVRAKHLDDDALATRCRAVKALVGPSGARVLVHGRPALVEPCDLDGCHLPDGADIRAARRAMPAQACLGVSAHPRHDGDVCAFSVDDGVDYATWSPIYAPTSKRDARRPLGIAALAGHRTPVIALGGIDASRAAACVNAGAHGVAVLGAIGAATDPQRALLALVQALELPWHRHRRPSRALEAA